MTRVVPPLGITLPDRDTERVRQDHERRIRELQELPFARARVIEGVRLKDGVSTPIAHKLGRPAKWVRESCVRGAVTSGRVEEVRDGKTNRNEYVVLKAVGWGATITIDLAVA